MPGSAFASSPARAAWDRSHQDGEGLEGAAQGGATVQRGAGPLAAALGLFLPLSSLPHAVWCCRILWGWGGGEMGDKYSQMPRARETRLCSPDSVNRVTLRLPRLAGQFQGRVPTLAAGWRGGLAGSGVVLGSEKPPLPGFVSPSWGRREGRGGRGAFGSARGELTDPRGQDAPERRQLRCGGAQPPPARRFPAPTSPGRRRRRRWAARDLSELATAEEDHVPSSRRS